MREIAKAFSTHDIIEEYTACRCFPVQQGWTVTSWATEDKCIEGVPMPNFAASFGVDREGFF